jgi:hypothetical protein
MKGKRDSATLAGIIADYCESRLAYNSTLYDFDRTFIKDVIESYRQTEPSIEAIETQAAFDGLRGIDG